MNEKPFCNSRYEYLTVEYPYNPKNLYDDPDYEKRLREGWVPAWCDITSDGVFTVYRRDNKRLKEGWVPARCSITSDGVFAVYRRDKTVEKSS